MPGHNFAMTLKRSRRRMRNIASRHPLIYLPLARFWFKSTKVLLNEATDLVIEGFPRSGNSFAEAAVTANLGGSLRLAHHSHSAAQVIYAAKQGVPCMLLIRDPIGAATSLVMHRPDIYDAEFALEEYVDFHRAVLSSAPKVAVVSFESLTTDFAKVIAGLNARYGDRFKTVPGQEVNEKDVFRILDDNSVSRNTVKGAAEPYSPFSSNEDRAKRQLEKQRIQQTFSTGRAPQLAARAKELHSLLLKGAI